MKKILLVLLLIAFTLPVFAIDFSVGALGLGGYTFTRYKMQDDKVNLVSNQTMDRVNYGGAVFFDATYAELGVSYLAQKSKYKENMTLNGGSVADGSGRGEEAVIGISLMGKWPFDISEKFIISPMFGAEANIALKQIRQPDGDIFSYDRTSGELAEDRDKDENTYPLSAWNSYWINVGGCADLFFTKSIFLRSEVIIGFRLPTKYEMGAKGFVEKQFGVSKPKLGGITGNPMLKLGLGYRF